MLPLRLVTLCQGFFSHRERSGFAEKVPLSMAFSRRGRGGFAKNAEGFAEGGRGCAVEEWPQRCGAGPLYFAGVQGADCAEAIEDFAAELEEVHEDAEVLIFAFAVAVFGGFFYFILTF